jgi:hypothetical protein
MNAIDVKPDTIWKNKKYTKKFCVQYYKDTVGMDGNLIKQQKRINQAHWRMRTGELVTTSSKKVARKKNLTETMKNKKGQKVWIVMDGPKMSFINGYLKGTPYKDCHAPVRAYVDYILKEQSQKNKKIDKKNLSKKVDKKEKENKSIKKDNKNSIEILEGNIKSLKTELEQSNSLCDSLRLKKNKLTKFLEDKIFSDELLCDHEYDMDKMIENYKPPKKKAKIFKNKKLIAELKKEIEMKDKKYENLKKKYLEYTDDEDDDE